MIVPAWMAAARALWSTWWPALVGAAVAAAPCFLVGQCSGKRIAADRYEAARAVANVEVVKKDGAAVAKAADERVADTLAIAEQQKELTDAVANLPDAMPSARRVALGCDRLRQAGTDTTVIPACGRPSGGGQTSAKP